MIHPDKVQIPHFIEVETVVAPIVEGIHAAIRAKHLKGAGVVLASALDIALNEANVIERWLAGEDVFVSAVDHELDRLSALESRRLRTS